MPRRTLRIEQGLETVWLRLQELDTWESIGGLHDLREPNQDGDGNLTSFAFSIDTPLGTIRDRAVVRTQPLRLMNVRAEAKGIEVLVDLGLEADESRTKADFSITANSTNFLSKALVGTLRHVLESSIHREGERMTERLEAR